MQAAFKFFSSLSNQLQPTPVLYSYTLRLIAQFPHLRFHSCHSWQHFNNSRFSIKKNPVEEFYCSKKHLPSSSFSTKLPFCCFIWCFSWDPWDPLKKVFWILLVISDPHLTSHISSPYISLDSQMSYISLTLLPLHYVPSLNITWFWCLYTGHFLFLAVSPILLNLVALSINK